MSEAPDGSTAATSRVPARTSARTARTAVVWEVLQEELARAGGSVPVLDVGGGTGGFAVPLAELGHPVTVVDQSPDALAALERRAAEAGVSASVRAVQGDAEDLTAVVDEGSQAVVLCHSLLESVPEPAAALASVARVLRPGGAASVLTANRLALVLSRAVHGHLADARHALDDPDGRWGPGDRTRRRFAPAQLQALVAETGLVVEALHGVRVVADLVSGALLEAEPGAAEHLVALELAVAGQPPFRDVATSLHVLARRPG